MKISNQAKYTILSLITLTSLISVFMYKRIGQNPIYHHFADCRSWLEIPNFANVISNLSFIFVGAIGLFVVSRSNTFKVIKLIYSVLFLGVFLVGLGSAYYHCYPNNDRLVWDRIPMTIVFMALLAATISELINIKLGFLLLFPLLILGIGSVYYWHYSEIIGVGDLRLYAWVQFYPVIALPVIIFLYHDPKQQPALKAFGWIVIWYIVAKICEQLDTPIYRVIGISGHTFKHLASAVSTWYFIVLFHKKHIHPNSLGIIRLG